MTIEQGLYQIGKELHEIGEELRSFNEVSHSILAQMTRDKTMETHQDASQNFVDWDKNGLNQKGNKHVD